MASEEVRIRVGQVYRRATRELIEVSDIAEEELSKICDTVWDREKENLTSLCEQIRSLRSKHETLRAIYLYDTSIVEREEEFEARKGALSISPGLTGGELLQARIARIDRLNELNVELQELLKQDVKLVGDEDRRVFSVRSFHWSIWLAIVLFMASAVVQLMFSLGWLPSASVQDSCGTLNEIEPGQYELRLQTCP